MSSSDYYDLGGANFYFNIGLYPLEEARQISSAVVEKPQAGALNILQTELVTNIILSLDLKSLANLSETNRYLNKWVVSTLSVSLAKDAECMITLLVNFFEGNDEKVTLCQSLISNAKILNCCSLYDLKKNLNALKVHLASLVLSMEEVEIAALRLAIPEENLPSSFCDFFKYVLLLSDLKQIVNDSDPSLYSFLQLDYDLNAGVFYNKHVRRFYNKYVNDLTELFNILLALPEYQSPYLIWFIHRIALNQNIRMAVVILELFQNKTEIKEINFLSTTVSYFRKKGDASESQKKLVVLCEFMRFDHLLAQEKRQEALKLAKNFLYYRNAFLSFCNYYNEGIYFDIYRKQFLTDENLFDDYFTEQFLNVGAYNEAIAFCMSRPSRKENDFYPLHGILHSVYRIIENKELDEFFRVMNLFVKKGVNVNVKYAQKAVSLTKQGQIIQAMQVARHYNFGKDRISEASVILSDLHKILIQRGAIQEGLEVFSWILNRWPQELGLIYGTETLLLALLLRGERSKIRKIVQHIPEGGGKNLHIELRTKVLKKIINKVLKKHENHAVCLVEAVFLANYILNDKVRKICHNQLLSLLKLKGFVAELAEAKSLRRSSNDDDLHQCLIS